MQTVEQTKQITQSLGLVPLDQVLEKPASQSSHPKTTTKSLSTSVKESLDEMFPEQEYAEKSLKQAKAVLGDLAKDFSTDELKNIVSEIQFLVETWLDDYEREVFDGLTLRELLHERGGK